MTGIAVVGMACRYPDARSPQALWENILAQRLAFRPIPPVRLRLADYGSADRADPDRTYLEEAAVLEGWEFDRVRFRVSGESFRAADLTHWLTLEVAADALADAGFPEGEGLPRDSVGVLLGNSLTGEFARASTMRYRWPYVRRVLGAALDGAGWQSADRKGLLDTVEAMYKAPFPAPGSETLAGGLSNTIAGRICNHFDLHGGGYTVDGACASSLLAVANACSLLAAGDLDIALAGGVDLSLDPFELVGFARAGALTTGEMRIYDRRSAGFFPGEGCGVAVLMREADAQSLGRRPYAVIRGWGISSDGSGGLTRPEVQGQLLSLRRAYARAGFGPATVPYFEGHGTGTVVGDATEIRALSTARGPAGAEHPAVVGSVKAVIGHTKAAAGIAGLIKAIMAISAQVIPPTTGCRDLHPELSGDRPVLRVAREGEPWPPNQPLRAGVSAMGFGGINTHVVLEQTEIEERTNQLAPAAQTLLRSAQDSELFLLSADRADELLARVKRLRARGALLSRAEMGDAAAVLTAELGSGRVRAAIVAATAGELVHRLDLLRSWLEVGAARMDSREGVFLGSIGSPPSIGFLFPGQGSPANLGGGSFRRRFTSVQAVYDLLDLPASGDGIATEVAQPAIVAASAAALALLRELGIEGTVAVGHSLGELTALHWGHALGLETLLRVAVARGRAMAELGDASGAMLSLDGSCGEVHPLLERTTVVVAGINAPHRTVVAGSVEEIEMVAARAREIGMPAQRLAVSHAFHSPRVAAAAASLARGLANEEILPLRRTVASTVVGRVLGAEDDLRELLQRQVTAPVLFRDALEAIRTGVDLWLEVGPGHTLATLATGQVDVPVMALDAGGPSLAGLLKGVGAAFALGAPLRAALLFQGRFTRPIDLDRTPTFLANPCEMAPSSCEDELPASAEVVVTATGADSPAVADVPGPETMLAQADESALELIRAMVAERAELPVATVGDHDRLLGDLHLNSITVAQLVTEAARRLGLAPPTLPTEYSAATVAQIAEALEEVRSTGDTAREPGSAGPPAGVDIWVRPFVVHSEARTLPPRRAGRPGVWKVIAVSEDPLAAPLRLAVSAIAGSGVLVCLPPGTEDRQVDLLLDGAAAHLELVAGSTLLVVQRGGGGAAFTRSLFLERPVSAVVVVDVPDDDARSVEWIVDEAAAASAGRYREVHYGVDGGRREPILVAETFADRGELPLGRDDVLLVTGGGKGITAECALALALESGAQLALLGRSGPQRDPVLVRNLERIAASGVISTYYATDVRDRTGVAEALRAVQKDMGPVTGVLHGAGVNLPRRIEELDTRTVLETLRPKLDGLRNVLAELDSERLRLLVGFSSIIARTGLHGEAHYALANEWLGLEVERFADAHPGCRCFSLEWSVWSGVGMGERLGTLEMLARQGVAPIFVDAGVATLRALVAAPPPARTVIVASRFGPPPTVRLATEDLPLLRFLERPRVHFPGVELVAEATLELHADPYLTDHVLGGEWLFPGVMGLEAMAQVAMAAVGSAVRPLLEEVRFAQPVIVPSGGSLVIRIAALVRSPGEVEVVVRTESTGFAVDHFRAVCRFAELVDCVSPPPNPAEEELLLDLNPERDLYGRLLFQGGRFGRLSGYRRLSARECTADLAPDDGEPWFGAYLPTELVLGDPGARDATMHAIQACIPHALLLPTGIERLAIFEDLPGEGRQVHAREREGDGTTFVYDVEVTAADGRLLERWVGLQLRRTAELPLRGDWPAPLLGPYLERRVGEILPGVEVRIGVAQGNESLQRRDRASYAARGIPASPLRRGDGRPWSPDRVTSSFSHTGKLTITASSAGTLSCDIEEMVFRSDQQWSDLLGSEEYGAARVIADGVPEELQIARTRVWAARECLRKADRLPDAPLILLHCEEDGAVLLASGALRIVTFVRSVCGQSTPVALAVLVEPRVSSGGRAFEPAPDSLSCSPLPTPYVQ